MQLSIGVPPGPQTTQLAVRAEEFGYDRIWFFDSPAIYEDIWIHHPAMATARPITVPILLSAFGPKGLAITREIADAWMGGTPPPEAFDWAVQMANGVVLAPGESPAAD